MISQNWNKEGEVGTCVRGPVKSWEKELIYILSENSFNL
jgi:hypothetical protein